MQQQNLRTMMLAEAIELLQTANRLQQQFFRIGRAGEMPSWEPPVDMYESGNQLDLLVALPGVALDSCQVTLEPSALVVQGERFLDVNCSPGSILRLEIPYGRFERRIALPCEGYQIVQMQLVNGCLRLQLERLL